MSSIDHALFLWLNLGEQAPAWAVALARTASLNLPQWLLAATLAVAIAGRSQWRAQAWRVLASVALAAAAAHVLKHGFGVARPFTLGLGKQWLPHSPSEGFPSSHASVAAAFALSACLAPLPWLVRGLLLATGLLVGWSRIALGLHFPSDVVAAICVGALCALAVQRLGARHRPAPACVS